MLFNSLSFLIFFPLVCFVYFVIPARIRYLWLLGASYYFYMCWNARYALLMALSTVITYASGLLIGRFRTKARLWVALSFGSNLAILFFFKYASFLLESLQKAAAMVHVQINLPAFDILLPVGISFYTFQALSYTMDVYRGEIEPERNLLKYALFVSFFPQLVAGPIERSKNLLDQVAVPHRFDYDRAAAGLQMMLWGFMEKLILADRAAIFVDAVYGDWQNQSGAMLLLATILFAFQIYCDFGGYSHIAIGAAQVLGIRLMDNFRQPYFATSVQDFWRRWHISLSTWFRDYLYIPLGGNRKGKLRRDVNLMITFVVSGLWHGADWHYVAWGGLNGAFQVIGGRTRVLRQKIADALRIDTKTASWKLLQQLTTFVLICLTWVFFRADGMGAAFGILRKFVGDFRFGTLLGGGVCQYGLDMANLQLLIVAILVLLAVDYLHEKGVRIRDSLARQNTLARWIVCWAALLCVLVFGIWGGEYDASAFIYFQF